MQDRKSDLVTVAPVSSAHDRKQGIVNVTNQHDNTARRKRYIAVPTAPSHHSGKEFEGLAATRTTRDLTIREETTQRALRDNEFDVTVMYDSHVAVAG